MGRLRNVKEDGQQVAQYTYDQNGNRSSITYGNNVTVDYTYNLGNRIKTLVNKNADGTALSQFSYTYYLDANEATKTDPQGETAYEYDGLGRLKTTAEPGNVQRAYTYDDRNNRSSVTTSGPLYENTEDMSYEYDGLNRLTKATGSHTATYQYDADGIRQSKTVDGLTTTHVLDGTDVAADITGADKTEYVRGINLICMKKNGQMYYYLFDAHGNVVQMVDQNGNIVNNYTYDEWGNTKSQTEGIENPFKYCGEYFDKETGLYYLRARYYDPTIGRFISEDSEWGKDNDPLSLNLYTYCQNDPVDMFDPSGHFSWKNVWNGVKKIASGVKDFIQGTGAGFLESITYGASGKLDVYYNRQNNTIYLIGKVTGNSISGIISGIGTFASGTFTIVTAPTVAGAAAGAAATTYCASVTVSSAGHAAVNVSKIINSSSGSNNQGMNNNRVLKDTKIKGYNVSMDLERGGSGQINIHLKINDTKYFFNAEKGAFLDSAGNRVPNALKGNQQIIDSLKKAQKLVKQGW